MSAKNAKKARKMSKNHTTNPMFGVLLPNTKFLGNPVTLGFGAYDTTHVNETYMMNSDELIFQSLVQRPVMFSSVELLEMTVPDKSGLSLGIHVIVNNSQVEHLPAGGFKFVENVDLFPFPVGTVNLWRQPRLGALLDDPSEEVLEQKKLNARFYETVFPGWDMVLKVEQVISPAGWGENFDRFLDNQLKQFLNN